MAAFCGGAAAYDSEPGFRLKKDKNPATLEEAVQSASKCKDGSYCSPAMKRLELAAEKYAKEHPGEPPAQDAPQTEKQTTADSSSKNPETSPSEDKNDQTPAETEDLPAEKSDSPSMSSSSKGAKEGSSNAGAQAGAVPPESQEKRKDDQAVAAGRNVSSKIKSAQSLFNDKNDSLAGPESQDAKTSQRAQNPERPQAQTDGSPNPDSGAEASSLAQNRAAPAGLAPANNNLMADLIVPRRQSGDIPVPPAAGSGGGKKNAKAGDEDSASIEARIKKLLEEAAANDELAEQALDTRADAFKDAARLLDSRSKKRASRLDSLDLRLLAGLSGKPLDGEAEAIVLAQWREAGLSTARAANIITLLERRKIDIPPPAQARPPFWKRFLSWLERLIRYLKRLTAR